MLNIVLCNIKLYDISTRHIISDSSRTIHLLQAKAQNQQEYKMY